MFWSRKEFFIATMDFSLGDAYHYKLNNAIPTPTTIKYGRVHSGKFQKGKLIGNLTNQEMFNVLYFLKRGCQIQNILIDYPNLKTK